MLSKPLNQDPKLKQNHRRVSDINYVIKPVVEFINHDHTYSKTDNAACNLTNIPFAKKNEITFFVLNVGGLKSKLNFTDFLETINKYDIVCLSEIKMDKNDLDSVCDEFVDFDLYSNITEHYQLNPRAGILVLVKKHVSDYITFYPHKSDLVLFFKIQSNLLNSNIDLLCGFVYIPPYSSNYAKPEDFETLQDELLIIQCEHDCDTLLFGDCNARTKTLCDHIQYNIYDDSLLEDDTSVNFDTQRFNQDNHEPDIYGLNLINLCKTSNLFYSKWEKGYGSRYWQVYNQKQLFN